MPLQRANRQPHPGGPCNYKPPTQVFNRSTHPSQGIRVEKSLSRNLALSATPRSALPTPLVHRCNLVGERGEAEAGLFRPLHTEHNPPHLHVDLGPVVDVAPLLNQRVRLLKIPRHEAVRGRVKPARCLLLWRTELLHLIPYLPHEEEKKKKKRQAN